MTADPVTEPTETLMDPIDLLIAFEEATEEPIRPQYVEGMVVVPPQPDHDHNDLAADLYHQFRCHGFRNSGLGNGYRAGPKGGTTRALVIPDFYVLHRRPSEVDEAYRKAHKGWYSLELLALAGEVTSSNHEIDTGPKYRAYAAAGVPVYVLVHRNTSCAYAFSEPVNDGKPEEAHYASKVEVELGHRLVLPPPFPALDTAAEG